MLKATSLINWKPHAARVAPIPLREHDARLETSDQTLVLASLAEVSAILAILEGMRLLETSVRGVSKGAIGVRSRSLTK